MSHADRGVRNGIPRRSRWLLAVAGGLVLVTPAAGQISGLLQPRLLLSESCEVTGYGGGTDRVVVRCSPGGIGFRIALEHEGRAGSDLRAGAERSRVVLAGQEEGFLLPELAERRETGRVAVIW
ncbi:MAG: hypothetical protein AB7F99_04080 [Vicinamibacterales bacterium]